jgi:hypothetical protein
VYPIDERDTLVALNDVPGPRSGAPMPLVLADDTMLLLSYFPSDVSPGDDQNESSALLEFHVPLMHLLGPPNDEAIKGHPLWRRGLDSYAAYRVEQSSLLRRFATMNYVHPRNDPAMFDGFHHYILTFEDSTFECLAQSYTVSVETVASDEDRRRKMLALMQARDEALRSKTEAAINTYYLRRSRGWRRILNPLWR